MLKAITRGVSRRIAECELTYRPRECVDYAGAVRQHEEYRALLARRGVSVINLEAGEEFPDCCFVADAAVVFDELAVVARTGAQARRGEAEAVAAVLSAERELAHVEAPATLDGGDVMVVGRRVFVGQSRRTNPQGVEALTRIMRPHGYTVTPVHVNGSLHLTTACSALDAETLLINPRWIDATPFARFNLLRVPEDEPWAANALRVGETVVVEAGAPRTFEMVARHCGPRVETLDISEFRKAEGSLTCLSILFADARGKMQSDARGKSQNKETRNAERA